MLIKILDFLASICILLGLWKVVRNRKWWLIYSLGSFLFVIVTINKGLVGMTTMGCITFFLGIKNYIVTGKKKEKGFRTWQAQIFCGLRKGYGPGILSIEKVYRTCQEYTDEIGWCVSVTPTKFIYKDGYEPGVIVGGIQYPRFPLDEQELVRRTKELAQRLRINLEQIRVSIAFPNETIMLEAEDGI